MNQEPEYFDVKLELITLLKEKFGLSDLALPRSLREVFITNSLCKNACKNADKVLSRFVKLSCNQGCNNPSSCSALSNSRKRDSCLVGSAIVGTTGLDYNLPFEG